MSNDPNDCRAKTPAHFIIEESLLSIAREVIDVPAGQRLKLLQRIQQDFWKQQDLLEQRLPRGTSNTKEMVPHWTLYKRGRPCSGC